MSYQVKTVNIRVYNETEWKTEGECERKEAGET